MFYLLYECEYSTSTVLYSLLSLGVGSAARPPRLNRIIIKGPYVTNLVRYYTHVGTYVQYSYNDSTVPYEYEYEYNNAVLKDLRSLNRLLYTYTGLFHQEVPLDFKMQVLQYRVRVLYKCV